jgi:hypothetical protein
MAYTPREIKDRVAVGDDIFQVEDLGDNRIRLIPTPTHVSEAGTPVNKALLQPIEDELGNLSATKVDKVPGKELSTNDYTNVERSKLNRLPDIKIGTIQMGGSRTVNVGYPVRLVLLFTHREFSGPAIGHVMFTEPGRTAYLGFSGDYSYNSLSISGNDIIWRHVGEGYDPWLNNPNNYAFYVAFPYPTTDEEI